MEGPSELAPPDAGWLPSLLIVVVAMGAMWPMLLVGPSDGHDLEIHGRWTREFATQFWHGELYPRWLSGMNEGLGSPTFFYYPPLSFWITTLLLPVTHGEIYRALGLSLLLALAVSGLTAWHWTRRFASPASAFAASLVYMVVPYHLAVDLYLRAACAEFWAFAWMPLVLHAARGVARQRPRSGCLLAVAYALLAMTHLPTVVTFSAFVPVYAAVVAPAGERVRAGLKVLLGMGAGCGLAAVYLLPALGMQQAVHLEVVTQPPWARFENNFFFGGHIDENQEFRRFCSVVMRYVMGMVGLGGVAFVAVVKGAAPSVRTEAWFWMGVTAVCLLMMTPLSAPLWYALPFLAKLQFPWRFAAPMSLAICALAAIALPVAPRPLVLIGTGIVAAWLTSTLVLAWPMLDAEVPNFEPGRAPSGDVHEYEASDRHGELMQAIQPLIDLRAVRRLGWMKGRFVTHAAFRNRVGTADTVELDARHLVVTVDSSAGGKVLGPKFYFRNWTATVDGEPVAVAASVPEGLLEVGVGPGRHRVELVLAPAPLEVAGRWVSALSALLLAFGCWRSSRRGGTSRSASGVAGLLSGV